MSVTRGNTFESGFGCGAVASGETSVVLTAALAGALGGNVAAAEAGAGEVAAELVAGLDLAGLDLAGLFLVGWASSRSRASAVAVGAEVAMF